jgi:outer membrane protein, heavy metal efflux system
VSSTTIAKSLFSLFIATFLVLLLGLPVRAETLVQLVEEALIDNPDLAAAKERWQQSRYKAPQAGSLNDPVLSLALSNYPSDSLASDETPMTGNEVRLAQQFPFPGKRENRAAQAEEQAKWYHSVYLDDHYQIARKVKDAWYRLYYQERASDVVKRNLDLLEDVVRVAEVRYETGSGLQQDVLKAQVERTRLMEQLRSIEQKQGEITAELGRLLSRAEPLAPLVPQKLERPDVTLSLADLQDAALKQRPLVDAYQALLERYRYQQKLAELDDYPDVTVWGSWRFRDDDLPDGGTDFVSAGVSFNLPVYREKRRAALAEAHAAQRMVEGQSRSFRDSVTAALRKAYLRMQETRDQANLYEKGIIPQTTQSFRAAMTAYQVGKVDFISLLDALMAAYQAEMTYHRYSAEYMRSLAWLEAESTVPLIGGPLPINQDEMTDVANTSDINPSRNP